MEKKKQNILVIRLSSIGDIILTSPVLRIIKSQLPNAQLHFLCKGSFSDLFSANPHIDQLWEYEKVEESEFFSQKFTHIVDLHKNARTAKLKMRLSGEKSSFEKENFNKWLLTKFKIDRLPRLSVVDRYVKALEFLGLNNDSLGLEFFIDERKLDRTLLSQLPDQYTALVVGAAHATKVPTIEKFNELISTVDGNVVLVGGKSELSLADALTKNHQGKAIYNFVGNCNLHESAQVLSGASVVITPDTGMMHMAAALKKPTVVLWGNTTPKFGMGPYYGKEEINFLNLENENLSCRPCSKIGYDGCPKNHFKCMSELDISPLKNWLKNNS